MTNRVLIITADSMVAKDLEDALGSVGDGQFSVQRVSHLSEAIERLRTGGIDAIMANLSLPDSQGIETFDKLFAVAPHIPIIILCVADDEMLTTEGVQRGAQGYLSKDHFGSYLVPQTLRNCIHSKALEEKFFIEKNRSDITLNSISDAVISTDMSGNVDYLNTTAENMTGWAREDAYGHQITEVMRLINSVTREVLRNPIQFVLLYNKPMVLAAGTILVRRDGREAAIEDSAAPIHDWDGKITGAVIVFHDVTAAQAMSLKMAYLAQHDFLTGLPNRLLLNDRITQAIALGKRRNNHFAVLFLDLDNFKYINDSLGHETGDALLQSVAQSLLSCVRSSDTVSRQGGDEFVILLMGDKYGEKAALAAEKILAAMTAPHTIADQQLHVTSSIGISVYPEDGEDVETLIKNADTAMYHAKEIGRNNYQYFKNEMNVQAVERQVIEVELRRALEHHEFVVYYQPRVNLATGMITGAEALVRWIHPDRGLELPGRFVEIAEDCGLILPIGQWMLQQVCSQIECWQKAGLRLIPVSVNISALEFRQKAFVEEVRIIVNEAGISPNLLQLEITESVLMDDAKGSIAILLDLKKMGILLAVDDFGTGYSSLSYLHQFPIDVLKIDQSFLNDITVTNDNGIIVSAVIAMGKSLKLLVVAEGVENQEQLAFLRAQHCEEGQGFLFSKPVAAEQMAKMLVTGLSITSAIS
ncbi:MAG: EAL domain-containing protein [Proteobacteria bacterium]|nr:EAL domain-containing protein [Pseudomonadota bacterium]